jgi:hypothetical protein
MGLIPFSLQAQELTPNEDINQFQVPGDFKPSYDFNAPPEGLFREIQTAEGFEEELGFRRANEYVPVSPTREFHVGSQAVFIVFKTHQHYESFQVFGICFPEKVQGLDPKTPVAQDVAYMALEDESGYLKIAAPPGGWKPGDYKVDIHVGWQVNEISHMGTMRFTVAPTEKGPTTGSLPPG